MIHAVVTVLANSGCWVTVSKGVIWWESERMGEFDGCGGMLGWGESRWDGGVEK